MKIGSDFDFEGFLDSALVQVLGDAKGCEVPVGVIKWDDEDAYDSDTGVQLQKNDFVWRHVNFELSNVGNADHIEYLVHWIDERLTFGDVIQEDSWEAIWFELSKGGDIHTPVNIALAYQPGYDAERIHVSDGWHRTALYLKAGRKSIPAIVGIPKSIL